MAKGSSSGAKARNKPDSVGAASARTRPATPISPLGTDIIPDRKSIPNSIYGQGIGHVAD